MIRTDDELRTTMQRIAQMQAQVARLRAMESDAANYHASSSGFLREIDRMQLEVREYLSMHPTEIMSQT